VNDIDISTFILVFAVQQHWRVVGPAMLHLTVYVYIISFVLLFPQSIATLIDGSVRMDSRVDLASFVPLRTSSSNVQNDCPDDSGGSDSAQEREAMFDLYSSLNMNWSPLSKSWGNRHTSICTWEHVHCTPTCRVFVLLIPQFNLTGSLPASISAFQSIYSFDVSFNQIYGSIPSLSSWHQLQYLSLNNNFFSGPLPDFSDLAALLQFDCSQNALSGSVPSSLVSLRTLQFAALHHNNFSGTLPPNFSSATSLVVFHVGSNQIAGTIPPSLFTSPILGAVVLTENQFVSSIPIELRQSVRIRAIDFSRNAFSGELQDIFDDLPELLYLDLSHNQLSGILPEFRNSRQVISCIVGFNAFTKLPVSWITAAINQTERECRVPSNYMPTLSQFDCSHCRLTDNLPTVLMLFSSFPALSQLQLSFAFDLSVSATNVNWFEVFSMKLCASVDPIEFTRSWFSSLNYLDLSGNNVYATFPAKKAFFGNVTALLVLSLASNPHISGSIDDDWSSLLQIDVRDTSIQSLPSFIQQSFAIPVPRFNNSVWCPQLIGQRNQVLMINDDFQAYANCKCAPGFAGISPLCTACPPGTYREGNFSDPYCVPCKEGYFARSSGLSTCTVASDGEYVDSDRTSSYPCPSTHAYCAGGLLLGVENYWIDGSNYSVSRGPVTNQILPCTKRRCSTTQNSVKKAKAIPSVAAWCSANRFGSLDSPASANVDTLIAEYYSNIACGRCLPGFSEISGQCIVCEQYHIGYLVLGWFVSLLVVFFLRRTSQATNRGTIQIFSFYTSVVRQLSPTSLVALIVSWLDLRLTDGGSAVCIFPVTSSIEVEVWLMIALAVTWLNVLVAMFLESMYRRQQDPQDNDHLPDLKLVYLRTFMVVVTISISSAIDTAISVLQSFYVPSLQTYRIVEYPDVDTSSSLYFPFFTLGLCLCIEYFMYLLVVLGMLRFGSNESRHPMLAEAIHIWKDAYKVEFQLWAEVYVIIRRVIFLLLTRFLMSSSSKMAAVNSVLLILVVVAMQFRLYQHSDDNNLEIFLLCNLVIFASFVETNDSSRVWVPVLSLLSALGAFIVALIRQHAICTRLFDFVTPKHDRGVNDVDGDARVMMDLNQLAQDSDYSSLHDDASL
jgi:hypothetical protein